MKKCVLLLSGGLDSVTTLAYISSLGYSVSAISFQYGQKHSIELEYAKYNAKKYNASHTIFNMQDIFVNFNSSLINNNTKGIKKNSFPTTYVPARNTIFLSVSLGFAESIDACEIFIGANIVDYSGYPDCRPEFIKAFESAANLGTSFNGKFKIQAPLINMTKSEIIKLGKSLEVDYTNTISCYNPNSNGSECGICDSCKIRIEGFKNFESTFQN